MHIVVKLFHFVCAFAHMWAG